MILIYICNVKIKIYWPHDFYIINVFWNLLGQWCVLQSLTIVAKLSQYPPGCSITTLVLVLNIFPLPQDLSHCENSDHGPHTQGTKNDDLSKWKVQASKLNVKIIFWNLVSSRFEPATTKRPDFSIDNSIFQIDFSPIQPNPTLLNSILIDSLEPIVLRKSNPMFAHAFPRD